MLLLHVQKIFFEEKYLQIKPAPINQIIMCCLCFFFLFSGTSALTLHSQENYKQSL